MLQFRELPGSEARPHVDEHYRLHGSQSRARDTDHFFTAWENDRLVGCVRFCVEENLPLLRTMMVAESHRGQRIGARLLERFAQFLDRREIRNTHCVPYSHLEKFYGAIGFEKVPPSEIPPFLQERIDRNSKSCICMKRP